MDIIQQPQAITEAKTKQPPRRYAYHWTRLSLRSAALFFYVLCTILSIVDGVRCQNLFNNLAAEDEFDDIDTSLCWTDGETGDLRFLLVAVCGMIWDTVELITLCVNKKGIHPGANLALDLLLWIVGLAMSITDFIIFASFIAGAGGLWIGANATLLIATIITLVLFVMDCIAVHKWRRMRYGYPSNMQMTPYTTQGGPLQGYLLPPAQPGFVYVQIPATALGQQPHMMMASPIIDPKQSVMSNGAASGSSSMPTHSELHPKGGNTGVSPVNNVQTEDQIMARS